MSVGELSVTAIRSVVRRYSDACLVAAARKRAGGRARYPRRNRALMPLRWHSRTLVVDGNRVRVSMAAGAPRIPATARLARSFARRWQLEAATRRNPGVQPRVRQVRSLVGSGTRRGEISTTVSASPSTTAKRVSRPPSPVPVGGVDTSPKAPIRTPWESHTAPPASQHGTGSARNIKSPWANSRGIGVVLARRQQVPKPPDAAAHSTSRRVATCPCARSSSDPKNRHAPRTHNRNRSLRAGYA